MLANESDLFFKNFKGMVFSVDLNLHIFSNYSLVRDPKHVLFNWLFFIICLDAPKLHGLLTQYQSLLVCYFDNGPHDENGSQTSAKYISRFEPGTLF